jgi:RHS repeat-associated protein
MVEPGRKFVKGSSKYRYGFNGKENDNEVKGEGNNIDFGSRTYDSRLGRFLSVDPLGIHYPWQSTYVYASDNPIKFIDFEGEGPGEPIDATLESRLKYNLFAFSFVDVLKKSNNFSLRALENWGWKNNPTQQQENKVKGLAGESIVVADLKMIPVFTHEKNGKKNSWSPQYAPATSALTSINASGDVDADKTIDIIYSGRTGSNLAGNYKFGITMPFVGSDGNVINKNKGETYETRNVNLVIEVKTGTLPSAFSIGFSQALRQTEKLNARSPYTQNVPVVAIDRDAYLQAIKIPSFKKAVDNFINGGGRILNIDNLNSRAESLKNEARNEVRNGTNPNSSLPSQTNRPADNN